MKKELKDNRSKRFVFLPFCVMAQAFQARGIVKYEWKASIKPIVKELIDNDVNIIQMPCSESLFGDRLARGPRGYSYYNCKEFNFLCEELSERVFGMIKKKGVFMKKLFDKVSSLDVEIPFIGINRKFVNKSVEKLRSLL